MNLSQIEKSSNTPTHSLGLVQSPVNQPVDAPLHFIDGLAASLAALDRLTTGELSEPTAIPAPAAQETPVRNCVWCQQTTPLTQTHCIHCRKRAPLRLIKLSHLPWQRPLVLEQELLQSLFSRKTPVTYAIFAINCLMYFLMAATANGSFWDNLWHGVEPNALLAFGAKTNDALQQGEWFRLITPVFLHVSGAHLLGNGFALAVVGAQVERLFGSIQLFLIYLLAGIGGVIGSIVSHSQTNAGRDIAVGASGAIFGLFGVLAIFGLQYRHELPQRFRQAFASVIFPAILANLALGFIMPTFENAAHLGGLLSGVGLALFIPYEAPGRERSAVFNYSVLTACLAVVFYCFTRAYQVSPEYFATLQRPW